MRSGRSLLLGSAVSVAAHLLFAVVLFQLPSADQVLRAAARAYEVPLESVGHPLGQAGAPARGDAPSDRERVEAGGAESAQNIDARHRGEGGDSQGAQDAILMVDTSSGIVLFDSPLNNLAARQAQRIRTARSRATQEDRRATPNPDDQAFLASGRGIHQERRPVSASDATQGARQAPVASVEGALPSLQAAGAVGARPQPDGTMPVQPQRSEASQSSAGTRAPSPGTGILAGQGARHGRAANVAHGRPPVDLGPAATPAESREIRIRDNRDAELLAASLTASWVQSSTRSAPRSGEGRGGVGGGGTPGVGGGRQEGGRASTHGPGDGRFAALDTSDARYRRWFLQNRRRVFEALRFPRARALAMDQGTAIFTVVVRRDGTLASSPRLVRSSGFDDLDAAARQAVDQATPFTPLPADLAPHLSRISIRLPIELSNPMM
ncbi:MAG: TonB family protein [Sandaracinaceae bacterium]